MTMPLPDSVDGDTFDVYGDTFVINVNAIGTTLSFSLQGLYAANPAWAAAVSWVFPSISFRLNNATCWSVINPVPPYPMITH